MDSSKASTTEKLSDVDKMDLSLEGRNMDVLVNRKKRIMNRMRSSLKRDIAAADDSLADDVTNAAPDGTIRGVPKGKWMHATLTLRRPFRPPLAPRPPKDVPVTLNAYVIGTGSTQQQLPEHVISDSTEVPELDCSKLGAFRRVGSGSQAIVHAAEYDGTHIAVKVLRRELASRKSELESFEREIKILANLTHPYINSVIGFGTVDGSPCGLLEWCASDASRQLRLDEMGNKATRREIMTSVPSSVRLRIVLQLAEALCFLHSGNALPKCFVMHRDLKYLVAASTVA